MNIITKRPTNDWHGSLSLYTNQPESSEEGATRRANFSLSGPLAGDALTTRLYGNLNKTDADSWDINSPVGTKNAAGHEGVRNKDINGVVSWKLNPQQILDFEVGYSRQGNIYAGDTQNSSSSAVTESLAKSGKETNRLYRQNYGITHNGIWDWGQSRFGVYYEKTNNTRMNEGLSGGGEGRILAGEKFTTNRLSSWRTSGELNIPLNVMVDQTLTVGAEWNRDKLDDPSSTSLTVNDRDISGISGSAADRSSKNHSQISALYIEDNIEPVPGTNIIPGLRFDYLSDSGGNFSPSLNLSQELGDYFKVKAGVARTFKAPNLYQSSEGYLLYSKGNGCPKDITSGGCYLIGNKDLDPEISVNKEIGLEFTWEDYHASVTYFRNDYQNKIVAGDNVIGQTASGAYILKWQNGGKALVDGIEASMSFPLVKERLNWNTNATWMITSSKKTPVILCRSSRNILSITRLTGPSPRRFLPASTGRYMADKNRVLMRKPAVKILAVCQVKSWALIHWWGRTSITILIKICVLMSASVISSINRSSDLLKGRIPITSQAGLIMPELPHHSDRSVSGALPA